MKKTEGKLSDTAVCIGNFDGVHRAHQELIRMTKEQSGELTSVVYTFSPHPRTLFDPTFRLLTTEEDKERCIGKIGADVLFVEPCTKDFLSLSPEEFAHRILREKLGAKKVFVGYDFTFGKGGAGTPERLLALGKTEGFSVTVLPQMEENDRAIKSEEIRKRILDGDFAGANALLGRPHSYSGTVVHGKKLARTWGFPTANIVPEKGILLPPCGVYVTRVRTEDGVFDGVSNVGANPTVEKNGTVKIETCLLDFDGDLYGKRIEIAFFGMIRGEKRFSSADELKKQIEKDVKEAKKCLTNR